MSSLIAGITSEYKNILHQRSNIVDSFSDQSFEAMDFDPSYKLDDEEIFIIREFSEHNYFIDICRTTFSTASLSQISDTEYNDIQFLAIIQGNQKLFQRITPSLYVNKKTMLDYSGQPKIVENRKQLEVRQESDAIYLPASDTLYFKSIGKVKAIFPGIEALQREATQPEVDSFLGNDFVLLPEDYRAESVGVHNRKRIADIIPKYNALSAQKKQQLVNYAREKAGVELDGDAFKITSDNDLKKLLYAMDERYYYADIYEENRVANSIRVVNGA